MRCLLAVLVYPTSGFSLHDGRRRHDGDERAQQAQPHHEGGRMEPTHHGAKSGSAEGGGERGKEESRGRWADRALGLVGLNAGSCEEWGVSLVGAGLAGWKSGAGLLLLLLLDGAAVVVELLLPARSPAPTPASRGRMMRVDWRPRFRSNRKSH